MQSRALVRVRYAPSPTGFLHLGGLRTALYNYLFARKNNGTFLLRIEDTDKTRQVPGSVEGLVRALKWCGVNYAEGPADPDVAGAKDTGDCGPYIQSQRLPIYREYAEKLVASGKVYRCFCSAERLTALREAQAKKGQTTLYDRACAHIAPSEADRRANAGEPHVIRLFVPTGSSTVNDVVLGPVSMPHGSVDDQVLMKSDGYPTYHLASVVDDHLMRISHVIRGQEWLASTPKHLILYQALGWEAPQFAHLPLLLNTDKSKLSKRHGDAAVEDFEKSGYLPSALVNFVALLGWTPPNNREVLFDLEEMVQLFDLSQVHKGNAVVDRVRLAHINAQHIKHTVFTSLKQVAPTAVATQAAGKGSSAKPAAAASGKAAAAAASGAASGAASPSSPLAHVHAELATLKLNEGHLPASVPDTALLKAIRSRLWPYLESGYAAALPSSSSSSSSPSSSALRSRLRDDRLNAILVAQHERVAVLPEFVPLVLPYLFTTEEFAAHSLHSPDVRAAAERVLAHVQAAAHKSQAKAASSSASEAAPANATTAASTVDTKELFKQLYTPLQPVLEALVAAWSASGGGEGGFEGNPMDSVKATCKQLGVQPGRVMLPLRLALTGLDVGAGMGDSLRLLGKREAVQRLQRALQAVRP
jgi:glutamyl-tRNA synthetase